VHRRTEIHRLMRISCDAMAPFNLVDCRACSFIDRQIIVLHLEQSKRGDTYLIAVLKSSLSEISLLIFSVLLNYRNKYEFVTDQELALHIHSPGGSSFLLEMTS